MNALGRCVCACLGVLVAARAPAAEPNSDHPLIDRALDLVRDVGDLADHTAGEWLRQRLTSEEDAARYGLHLDEDWQRVAAAAPQKPLVVLIHGFNSSPLRNAGLLKPVRAAGIATGVFAYPNDWALADSAAFLSQELKTFALAHPDVRLALVTHSMGGLVARACVENDRLDPGNVTRLLMIAPPTHGSLVARLSLAGDLWEHWIDRRDGDFKARFRDSLTDGLGDAGDDLVPGSAFLAELNARNRNPRIKYSIFLGSRSAASAAQRDLLRWALAQTLRGEALPRHAAEIDALLEDLDELVDGQGDGVVALKRGRLDGVDDVVILPFDHLSSTDEPADDAVRQLHAEVMARLK